MEQLVQQFVETINSFVSGNNIFLSLFFGVLAIMIESIIPALPLAVFIAINMIAFGNLIGFIISWLATVTGCSISFFICRKLRNFVQSKLKEESKVLSFIDKIDKIKFSSLFLIIAMPFTPAFSVNIAAGLSKMEYKKYLIALLFSKIFIVYFWGYVGTTIVESISDIQTLIKMGIVMVVLFIISKIITKKYNL